MSLPDCFLFFYFSRYSRTEKYCHKNEQLRRHKSEGGDSQRIKHYISGNPINVETNVIETVTPEEYIRDTFQNVSDSEKE